MSRYTQFASDSAGDSDYRLNIDDDGTKIEAAFPGDDDIEFHELIANADGIDDICTLLHSESMAGNAERVRFIVKAYADKNILVKLGSNKETALHVAAGCGNTEVVEVLIDAARSRLPTSAHEDPHHPITCFEDFIRHPNDSMNTALHLAVSNGHMAIAKRLLEADPNDKHIQNSKGETPIYLAAKLGYEEMVQMMCEACTAPSLAGPDGTTALHAAILMLTEGKDEGLSVVEAIIDAAKTSASSTNKSFSSVKSFLRQSNKKDKDTALHLAVRRNHLSVAKHILEVDPSMLIINKQSDFRSTIYKAAEQGYMDMVSLLCDRYEAQNNLVHRGQTALIAAIIGRDRESVIVNLESAKHLVTCDDHTGWTPLHYAAYYKFDSVLEIIVEAQASVTSEVVYKMKIPTPLSVAVKEGHISTAIRLMELSPDLCIVVNHEGQNILHMAAVQNNKNMVQGILENCPQEYIEKILNGKDVDGNTPLHLLISQGCFIPELIYSYKWIVDMPGRENKNWTLMDMVGRKNTILTLMDRIYYESMIFTTNQWPLSTKEWPVDRMTRNKKNWTPTDMLYFQEQITGDQVQIKIAIDFMQGLTENRRRYKEESKTRESLVPLGKRSRKDAKFEMVEEKLMKEDAERRRQKANIDIVITALITTIAFTVGFTMPGGLHQSGEHDQGLAVLSKKTSFIVFMVSDATALLLSANSLFLYFWESLSEKKTLYFTKVTTLYNIASVVAIMVTFISGTYVVLSHTPGLAIMVAIISSSLFIYQISLFMTIFLE